MTGVIHNFRPFATCLKLAIALIGICLLAPNPLMAEETSADEATVVVGTPGKLEAVPNVVNLVSSRARQQLIVTGHYSNAELRDLSHAVKWASSNPKVVRVEDGIAIPVADGQAELTVTVGKLKQTVKVTVSQTQKHIPISFENETLAALTKTSCNMGACHGSPSGKGGFRLSLRAFDPVLDIMTLRSEFYGRRTNIMQPEESLLLKKPLMEVGHGGGRRLTKGGPAHTVLREWIAEGMRRDPAGAPTLQKIEIYPSQRVLHEGSPQQQTMVVGTFSDNTTRDLTALTDFSSSDENVASVSTVGLVTKNGRGESAILARYLDKMATCYVTFLEEVPGFAWNNPTERNFIDKLAFAKMQQLQILPSDLCTDAEFVRRAYLDTAGRLPTVEETTAFLASKDENKRNQLIDQLVDSADFASFWSLKWSDVLRSSRKKINQAGVHKFHRWIYHSILNDKPFDQLVTELLTASGSVYENPAANYWRASRDPNDSTETTAQLFMGIRIQCAKCHNHPFEVWTQDNYYGIAAAFARIGRKKGPSAADEEVIFTKDSGEIKQPRTGQTMKVFLPLKGEVDVPADQDRRAVFAKWLTAADNPFFAKTTVNRIWGHLMGRGIVDPIDDFRASNPPSNAELLDELTAQFVANGFRQKWAVKTIMQSQLYQLSSRKNKFNENDEIYGSHAATRLLGAEQLLDAICQVTGVNEKYAGLPAGTRAVALPDPPTDHYFLKVFGQPQREMACQCERSSESNLSQALQMINGPVVHGKLREKSSRITAMIDAKKSDEEIITTLYLASVSRNPVPEELAIAKAHIAKSTDHRQALEDVGWAILNSKEFLFQH